MADPDWFVIISDEIRGPFNADQMRTAAQKGLVLPHTQVRKGLASDWFRADQIQGLLPPAAPAAPPALEPEPPASLPAPTPVPAAPPAPAPTPLPTPEPVSDDLAIGDVPLVKASNRGSSPLRRAKRRKRKRANLWPVLIAAVAGFGLLMALLYWLSLPGTPKPVPASKKPAEQTSRR